MNPAQGVQCRPERPDETGDIARVVADAFGDESVAELVHRLRSSPEWIDGCSFVAMAGGGVVGHIAFSHGLLDAPRRLVDVLVLSPVSVATAHRGRGIGSALIRYGLSALETRPEPLMFLEGSPTYYPRFGFEPAGDLGFRRPSLRIPDRAFQVIRLAPYEPWMMGTLVYSRVFWDMDAVGLRDERDGAQPSRP